MMLVSGFRITGAHLIRQLRYIQNAQAIQHNMDMDIAGLMVSILMGTDQNLMSREMLLSKLHSHLLGLLHGSPASKSIRALMLSTAYCWQSWFR